MTTILITPAVVQALRAWNSDVARARADYEAEPTRSCRWWDKDVSCDELRAYDTHYCPRHRRAKNKANAKRQAKRTRDNARRRAARAAA